MTRRVALLEGLLLLSLAAAALRMKLGEGIQLELLLLGLLVAPAHLRRLLFLRGRLAPPALWPALLEGALLAGVDGGGVAVWSLRLGLVVCLLQALPPWPGDPRRRGPTREADAPYPEVALLLLAFVALTLAATGDQPLAPVRLLLLLPFALEALVGWRDPSGRALLARVAAALALVATTWTRYESPDSLAAAGLVASTAVALASIVALSRGRADPLSGSTAALGTDPPSASSARS